MKTNKDMYSWCGSSCIVDGIVFPPFISPTLQLKCADNNLDSLPS